MEGPPILLGKIRASHNAPLSDGEYDLCGRLCDAIAAAHEAMPAKARPGGVWWGEADRVPAHRLFAFKGRRHLDHLVLLNNRFRGFPTIAYEDDALTPHPDYWVRRYGRLASSVEPRWRYRMPARFGEIGWDVEGFPVSRYTCVVQERINLLVSAGVPQSLSGDSRALEIGSGGGEMGYWFSTAVPGLTWLACDIPSSLVYNACRLAILLPQKRHAVYLGSIDAQGVDPALVIRKPDEIQPGMVVNIPHFLLPEFATVKLDLTFNAWSMGEMTAKAVKGYARVLARMTREGGVVAEQNGDCAQEGGCDPETILPRFFRWRRRIDMPASFVAPPHAMNLWASKPRNFLSDAAALAGFDDAGDVPDADFPVSAWFELSRVGLRP